jgi:hypothetical protein
VKTPRMSTCIYIRCSARIRDGIPLGRGGRGGGSCPTLPCESLLYNISCYVYIYIYKYYTCTVDSSKVALVVLVYQSRFATLAGPESIRWGGFATPWPGSSRPGRASPKGWRSLSEPTRRREAPATRAAPPDVPAHP